MDIGVAYSEGEQSLPTGAEDGALSKDVKDQRLSTMTAEAGVLFGYMKLRTFELNRIKRVRGFEGNVGIKVVLGECVDGVGWGLGYKSKWDDSEIDDRRKGVSQENQKVCIKQFKASEVRCW